MSQAFLAQLRDDGVVVSPSASLQPLKGGVSSDIYLVKDGDKRLVVKQALPQLRVTDEWYADVARNITEREYMEFVSKTNPTSVPRVLAVGDGYFAMEYLGDEFKNWKVSMICGRFSDAWASRAGAFLGDVHKQSAGDEELAQQFDKMDNFFQLRIEPYLLTAGSRHPSLESIFKEEAERLRESKLALIHGDFSPKNILVSKDRLVVLDSEVACYADPAFDVAFLMSHLLLKLLYHKNYYSDIQSTIKHFLDAYGIQSMDFEYRVGKLMLLLLIARVDGKSPVEYLVFEDSKAFLRSFARLELIQNPRGLNKIVDAWIEGVMSLQS